MSEALTGRDGPGAEGTTIGIQCGAFIHSLGFTSNSSIPSAAVTDGPGAEGTTIGIQCGAFIHSLGFASNSSIPSAAVTDGPPTYNRKRSVIYHTSF